MIIVFIQTTPSGPHALCARLPGARRCARSASRRPCARPTWHPPQNVAQYGQADVERSGRDTGSLAPDQPALDQLRRDPVESGLSNHAGPEIDVARFCAKCFEGLAAQGVLSLKVLLRKVVEPWVLHHRGQLVVVSLDHHSPQLVCGGGNGVCFQGNAPDPFVAVGVGNRELCIEGIAALPETTNSMLAPVVNFLILSRRQTVRVGRRSGFFVASGCSGFYAVKVAQRGTEDEVESPKKPVFIKVFQGARVAELVDAPDLGSGSLGSEGSTPFARTIFNRLLVFSG